MTRFSLLGSSSGRNAGDAALIAAIIDGLRAEVPDAHFEIPTISPAFLRRHYSPDLVTPVPLFPWNASIKFFGLPVFRSVRRCDLTVVFDAVLFDRALWNPLFNYLSTLRFALPYAKRHGRRVAFYNVGIGPIHSQAGRRWLRDTFAAGDLFLIRDPDSLALAREVGLPAGRPVRLTADAALNHRPAPEARIEEILRSLKPPADRPLVGFNVNSYLDTWASASGGRLRREEFTAVMAEVADRMAREWGATVVFFVTQHMDEGISAEVIARMREREAVRVLHNREHAPEELQGVMGHVDLFFGMRFHSLLLALSRGTPIVGLAYQKKVTSLFDQIQAPEAALSFDGFGVAALWGPLDREWKSRASRRAGLEPIVAGMKALAASAAVETAALLGKAAGPTRDHRAR